MSRRILLGLLSITSTAAISVAGTSGFNSTFEEVGFPYPPVNQPLFGDFAAPVGTFEILTPGIWQISTNDPVNGPLPCDPTTTRAAIADTSLGSADMRFAFPAPARGNMIVRDKAVLGAEFGDRYGLEFGVYSAGTFQRETVFQFGPNHEVLVYGAPIEVSPGVNLTYDSLWANDCLAGIDNHFTVLVTHDLAGRTARVDVELHGNIATTYTVGPFAINPSTGSEGIGGMYVYAPRDVGRAYVDAMVCVGQASVILAPTGGTGHTGGRDRY